MLPAQRDAPAFSASRSRWTSGRPLEEAERDPERGAPAENHVIERETYAASASASTRTGGPFSIAPSPVNGRSAGPPRENRRSRLPHITFAGPVKPNDPPQKEVYKMKRILALLLILCVAALPLAGGALPVSAEPAAVYTAFRLSGVTDVTDGSGARTYAVFAPYTDTYRLTCPDASALSLSRSSGGEIIAEGETSLSASLTENETYTLTVRTAKPGQTFSLETVAENHTVTLPYDVLPAEDVSNLPLEGDGIDPLEPAKVNYVKRDGGTYVYINNPEQIRAEDVGQAFLRTEGLTGEVYMTFENANYSGRSVYLGYQLKNEGKSDVYVTVLNVGYQAGGTWFGQRAWFDFYNTKFEFPDDYATKPSKYHADYAYQDYTPRIYQPKTYRLPAGEAFYVIGGTTEDAYLHISVDNSADRPLGSIKCANGNVKFAVSGGSVTGTFYVYNDPAQVAAEPAAKGYRVGDRARQYLGVSPHAGVIDNQMTWVFSDETANGALPVTYTNRYASSLPETPYAAYNSADHTVERANSWMTHLNPQNDHAAVGTDMVTFPCTDENGNEVVIDNDHADGAGKPANTGNWMIEYQDQFTLVNQGDTERTVTLNLQDHGTLALLARDSATGEVLEARYTMGLGNGGGSLSGPTYQYAVTVPAHSVRQVTLDYLLVACSYGSVIHSAQLSGEVRLPSAESGSAGPSETPSTPAEPSETTSDGSTAPGETSIPVWAVVLLVVVLLSSICAVCFVLFRRTDK